MKPLIKICGLRTQEALDAAQGADLAGFIFNPASPRAVEPEEAARLRSWGLRRTGLFMGSAIAAILDIVQTARLDMVQLHGDQSAECGQGLAEALGRERVIRVLWPERYASLDELSADMDRHARYAGMLLLDAGRSGGGSGQRLDWRSLAGLRTVHPWMLAGGLDPDNVVTAYQACTPHGLDLNSGLESVPGVKDPQRIRAAIAAIRGCS